MKNNLAYWITTGLFAFGLTGSGLMTVSHQPPMVAAYTHLGYPIYFMTLLGAAKLAGVAAVLAPGLPRLKEWAYAGFAITIGSALIAHLAVGDGPEAWGWAVATGALWGLSYFLWHRVQTAGPELAATARMTT